MSPTPVDVAAITSGPVSRSRLQPIGGHGKSAYIAGVCLALSLLGALISGSYSKGGTALISLNAPHATLRVDNNINTAGASGSLQLSGLPFGMRSLQINHKDYEPYVTNIRLGWLSANHFSFQLTPIPLTLFINTTPGAEISLNGRKEGNADKQGVFVKSGIMPGDYDIQVTLPGHDPFRQHRHLSPSSERISAWLNVSQARIQEMQEQQKRAQEIALKVAQLLRSGQQQFGSRQYQAALASVDEALKFEPGNAAAQQLRNRIVQTINILK